MTGRVDQSVWSAAVNAALLGTDRSRFAPAGDGALGAACLAIVAEEADTSAALLRAAGAIAMYRRCGWIPALSDERTPPVCPTDNRPLCSAAAAGLLRRLLNGEHEPLLRLWLQLALARGVRPPADALRDLLDAGRRDSELGSEIVAVGGPRAAWLASFNEDWSYATRGGASLEELTAMWETASSDLRSRAFESLRRLDPAHARGLLEASWSKESVSDRISLLAGLATGLSLTDEPLLERALGDKRKEVRQRAAELLSQIPESALVGRMITRARSLVSSGTGGILRKRRIDVVLPGEDNGPALAGDGINLKPPPSSGIGERAWWFAQIVALVPPATWASAWSLEPSQILGLVKDHEWREPLVAGWLTATLRYRDQAWAAALWNDEPMSRIGAQWGAPSPERVFVEVVPSDRVDAALRSLIAGGHEILRQNGRVLNALVEWREEWSDALARAVAGKLKYYAGVDKVALAGEFGLRALIERAARAVPVSATDAFTDGWPAPSDIPTWTSAIDQLASVLRFRNDLHLAFSEESVP